MIENQFANIGRCAAAFCRGRLNRIAGKRSLVWAAILGASLIHVGTAWAQPTVNVSFTNVTSGTPYITITGDDLNDSVSVSWSNNVLTITGGIINSQQTSITFTPQSIANPNLINPVSHTATSCTFHTGSKYMITGTLGDGDDYMLIQSVQSSDVVLSFGNGNDQLRMNYCVFTAFNYTGGSGSNTISVVASKVPIILV